MFINAVVEKIDQYRMEGPALILLYCLKPGCSVVAEIGVLPCAPFLEFLGLRGYDYVAFLNKRENVERLIKKIEEKS